MLKRHLLFHLPGIVLVLQRSCSGKCYFPAYFFLALDQYRQPRVERGPFLFRKNRPTTNESTNTLLFLGGKPTSTGFDTMASSPSWMDRTQTSLIYRFWRTATFWGMRKLGNFLKQHYPSAYGSSIFYVETQEQIIALTIDDGFCRGEEDECMVSEVCELLDSYKARATFFVCTDYTTQEQCQKVLHAGHELGNHMKEDLSGYYSRLTENDFARELDEANQKLLTMLTRTDNETPEDKLKWFRAPQGLMSRTMHKVLTEREMINVMGDCYCDDWCFAEKLHSTNVVAPLMLDQVQPGSIAIFHMPQRSFRTSTIDALRDFLEGLGERGLRCVTLSDLTTHDIQQHYSTEVQARTSRIMHDYSPLSL